MKYPNRLRVLRAEKKLSQLDVATHTDIKEYRYWRIENGYEIPSEDERARIAKALDVEVSALEPQTVTS